MICGLERGFNQESKGNVGVCGGASDGAGGAHLQGNREEWTHVAGDSGQDTGTQTGL